MHREAAGELGRDADLLQDLAELANLLLFAHVRVAARAAMACAVAYSVLDCKFEAAPWGDTPAGNRAEGMCRMNAASFAVRTFAVGPHSNPLTFGRAREIRAHAHRARSWTKALVASLGLLLVCTPVGSAQTETGRISGSVVDATDAVVPNARVTVES
jgi:hypothetical protein